MNNYKFTRQNIIFLSLIIALLAILIPQIMRSFTNTALIGQEQYYNLMISENLLNNFSFEGYKINLIHFILAIFPFKIFFMRFIPLVFGLISIILFYLILSKFKFERIHKFIVLVLFILTPYFIYSFTHYTFHSFVILLNLISVYFMLKKKILYGILSIIPLIFICLPSILLSILLLFIIFRFINADKKYNYYLLLLFFISIIVYFSYYFPTFIPNKLFFTSNYLFSNMITDFGAELGITMFHFILTILGIVMLWIAKKRYKYHYLLFIALFMLSTYFEIIQLFLSVFFAVFGSVVIISLYKRHFEIENLKSITLMLIFYGLIFSAISFQIRLVNDSPHTLDLNALKWLANQEDGDVFSHPTNSNLIKYFSNKNTIIDTDYLYLNDPYVLVNDTHTIYYSRNLAKTSELLEKYKVKYIYINDEMKSGLVWEKRDDGLLFLLDNSDVFAKIYDLGSVEIWKYNSTLADS